MDTLLQLLPLANFILSVIIYPMYRIIKNQEKQISDLVAISVQQREEITLLREIVLEVADAEVVVKHLTKRGNHG